MTEEAERRSACRQVLRVGEGMREVTGGFLVFRLLFGEKTSESYDVDIDLFLCYGRSISVGSHVQSCLEMIMGSGSNC